MCNETILPSLHCLFENRKTIILNINFVDVEPAHSLGTGFSRYLRSLILHKYSINQVKIQHLSTWTPTWDFSLCALSWFSLFPHYSCMPGPSILRSLTASLGRISEMRLSRRPERHCDKFLIVKWCCKMRIQRWIFPLFASSCEV